MVSHSVFSAAKSELSQHDVFVQLGNNFGRCQFRMGLVHIIWKHPSKSFLKKKKKGGGEVFDKRGNLYFFREVLS